VGYSVSAKLHVDFVGLDLLDRSCSGDQEARGKLLLHIAETMISTSGPDDHFRSSIARAFRLAAVADKPEKVLARELGLKVAGRPRKPMTEADMQDLMDLAEDLYFEGWKPKSAARMPKEFRVRRDKIALRCTMTSKSIGEKLGDWVIGWAVHYESRRREL
jgi:hypothetical protein